MTLADPPLPPLPARTPAPTPGPDPALTASAASASRSPGTALRSALHLLAFSMPLGASAYLLTGPHSAPAALAWIAFPAALIACDAVSPPDRRQPGTAPAWPFDAILAALVALHFANLALLLRYAAASGPSVGLAVAVLMAGIHGGWSAIVVAHELIHRPSALAQGAGRLLMASVLYEHFTTEHVRGHHARVGTAADPATARFGEPFWAFYRRTVPAQLWSAWSIEARRLGADPARPGLWALRSRVLHGAALSLAFLIAAFAFDPWAGVALLGSGWIASLLLEAVNWFEHWGIVREKGKVQPEHSWDAESWVTLYALVGLSRHADHHAHANRPFPTLRAMAESPKLPYGYLAMVILALFADGRARRAMAAELRRLGRAPTGLPAAPGSGGGVEG